jgi:hypothetical protein
MSDERALEFAEAFAAACSPHSSDDDDETVKPPKVILNRGGLTIGQLFEALKIIMDQEPLAQHWEIQAVDLVPFTIQKLTIYYEYQRIILE